MLTLYLNPSSFIRVVRSSVSIPDHARVFVDSIVLKRVLDLFDISIQRRCFDLSLVVGDADPFFKNSDRDSVMLFVGGSSSEADVFRDVIKQRFDIQGRLIVESGFAENLSEKIDNLIQRYRPTHLVLGLGAPLQEILAIRFDQLYPSLDIRTCGGFITQTAISRGDFYPAWIQRFGVRWFYRFIKQPKVIYRVIFEYPAGIYHFVRSDIARRYRKTVV